jgi:hypothetical protein
MSEADVERGTGLRRAGRIFGASLGALGLLGSGLLFGFFIETSHPDTHTPGLVWPAALAGIGCAVVGSGLAWVCRRRRQWPVRQASVRIATIATTGASLLALGRLAALWYMGSPFGGSGASLREPAWGYAAGVLAISGCIVAIVAQTVTGRTGGTASRAVAVGASGCVAAFGLLAAAVWAYPSVQHASVVGLDPSSGKVLWRTRTSATGLLGIRTETSGRLVIEAIEDDAPCEWRSIAITIDRARGRIVHVVELPTFYQDASEIPPPPSPPSPSEFVFHQGSDPWNCSS